jgi:two-component system, OmpR family, response regulator MtrA
MTSADRGAKRILVLEDDPGVSELIGVLLVGDGFEPVFAASGKRALELVRADAPDLVIADLHIQGADSLDTIVRNIRALARGRVPLLLTSALHDANARRALDAYDFVPKPFDVDDFLAAVRRGMTACEPAAA